MKLPRRRFLHLAAGAATLPAMPGIAWAQAYPSRGVADLFARLVGKWLAERFGQAVIIENRAGAGSNVAAEAVARAQPDGYTLLFLTSSNSYNVALYDQLNFNFIRDIAPVAS